MFSPKIFKILPPAIKFSGWTKLFPFSWDANMNLLKAPNSPRNQFLTKVFFIQYVLYIGYNLYHLHDLVMSGSAAIMDIFWLGFFPGGYYVSFEGVLAFNLKKEEMVTFFRWMTEFDIHLKGK